MTEKYPFADIELARRLERTEAQGNIDYLFEKAPSKVRSAIGFEQRSELTERSCQDYSDD